MTGIYRIISPSNSIYIGQSRNMKQRWHDHRKPSKKKTTLLMKSFNKYGSNNHCFEIIHELPDDITQSILNEYECLYMKLYKDCGVKLLNLKEGGTRGKLGEEEKRKLSIAFKGRFVSQETREKISKALKGNPKLKTRLGVNFSEETRQKMSASSKNRIMSDATKKKLSDSKKGKPNNQLGLKRSSESRARMSLAQKNKLPVTDEARRNMSEAGKGRVFSDEHKKKIGLAGKGRKKVIVDGKITYVKTISL
jgi:group I intron endonuclease